MSPVPGRPLDGFRVLDLSRFLSGPYCTMVLADLGADVVKLEQPGTGDDTRAFGPFRDGHSYTFIQANRGKRSLAMDLKSERGAALVRRLIADTDLVVENFRPGVTKRLGLDYDSVRAIRPDILYCSISGYGQTGPDRDRPGFDIMAQGMSGLLRMTGQPDGRPAKAGFAVNDIAAGTTAVYSILAAQLVRRQTGQGQYIDISLVDSLLAWTVWEAGALFGSGEVPAPTGTRHRRSAPYQAYRTADGYVTIGANNDRLWTRVTQVLGRPEWRTDPRFADNDARLANVDELEHEIESVTTTRSTAEWVEELDRAGVPCGPILTYDEALSHPQVLSRDMVVESQHPVMGPTKVLGVAPKFSDLDVRPSGPAPLLGQHSREVLTELGLSVDEVDALVADGVIAEHT